MPKANYIDVNGLTIQELQDIINELTVEWKNIYGQGINLEQNSPDGQLINILSQIIKDLLDLFASYYNNLDPDTVIGIPQQILYKLNGLKIKEYSYSFVKIVLNINAPVELKGLDNEIDSENGTGYTITDSAGNRWILTNTVSLTQGTYELIFRAANIARVDASPETITTPETILAAVTNVTNPSVPYIYGNTGETVSEFRTRRNKMFSLSGRGFCDSLEAQLLNLNLVKQAKVYENKNDAAFNSIPPHGIWVIADGGSSDDIGRAIYANLPPGIPMKGKIKVLVPKLNGEVQSVFYDTQEAEPLYIKMTLRNLSGSELDIQNIKEQIVKSLVYAIYENAETATITTMTKSMTGENALPYDVKISKDQNIWDELLTPTNLNNYFSVSAENIEITTETNDA